MNVKSIWARQVVVAIIAFALLLFSCSKKNEAPVAQTEATADSIIIEEDTIPKPTIYITFDDGPNEGTKNLLRVINEVNVPMTAFVIGKNIYANEHLNSLYRQLVDNPYIEVANHSYTHANGRYKRFYQNPENVRADFNRTRDSIRTNIDLARMPGRNIWRCGDLKFTDLKASAAAGDLLQDAGYRVVGWDMEWGATKKMHLAGSHEKKLEEVEHYFETGGGKRPGHLILLSHDQYLTDEDSVRELTAFITKLKESGKYRFKKLSEYPFNTADYKPLSKPHADSAKLQTTHL